MGLSKIERQPGLSFPRRRESSNRRVASLHRSRVTGLPGPACAKPKRLLHQNATKGRLRFGEGRQAGQ
jgi:hypothetical protein